MKEIISVICPHCKAQEMELHVKNLETRKQLIKIIRTWRCPKCVLIYDENWFDEFPQFENLVSRSEKGIKEYKNEVKLIREA